MFYNTQLLLCSVLVPIRRGLNFSIQLMGGMKACESTDVSRHQEKPSRSKNARPTPMLGLPRNSWVSRSRCCIISILVAPRNVPNSILYLPPFLVFFFTPPPKRMAFWGLGAALRFAILDFLSARSAFCFVTLRSWVVVLVRGAPSASSSCITSASASADRAPVSAWCPWSLSLCPVHQCV